jgi:hypothetical protein
MSTLQTALAFTAHRFTVLPLRDGGKEPRTQRGYLSASSDPGQIREWWARWPNANLGVVPRQDVVVFDIDPRNGGDESLGRLERELGPLPPTWVALTGSGGQHFYLTVPSPDHFSTTLAEGIDVKTSRGYVVAPPSVHPNGRLYFWDSNSHPSDIAIAPMPASYLAATTRPSRSQGSHAAVDQASNSFLAVAFREAGLLGTPLHDGRIAVECPWLAQHSDGRGNGSDSSSVILAPTTERRIGWFCCAHSHCVDRSIEDVLAALPIHAKAMAAVQHPAAMPWVARRLSKSLTSTRVTK